MLAASTHLGTTNVDFQMEQYVYKRRPDGVHILNLRKTWEKLLLAARAIVAIEHPAEVFVISSRPYGQRAVLKFAAHTGATPIAGRFTPGKFAFFKYYLRKLTDKLISQWWAHVLNELDYQFYGRIQIWFFKTQFNYLKWDSELQPVNYQ